MKRTDRVGAIIMLAALVPIILGFLLFVVGIGYFEVGYELLMRDD